MFFQYRKYSLNIQYCEKMDKFFSSPLPKIRVQQRQEKASSRITQMIKKLGKRRQIQILEERCQGFWVQQQVKNSLDRIKIRAHKMKTQPLSLGSYKLFNEDKRKRNNTVVPKSNLLYKKKEQKQNYLPQLNQMIQARQLQSSSLIIAKRRKIIHLLILGLNRRQLGKIYDSLDIVLLASYYFQKDDQQRKLKTMCLNLISKLHKEIKMHTLSLKRKNKLNKKRRSLTVINYYSRQNFMQNFMEKLRKTKLIGQFSYSESKKNHNNIKKINAKCDVIIPEPHQIFDQSVQNYDYVTITVDDYTNMFPYQYPKSLKQKISHTQYRQMICKLNGLLFPESKCYSFSSIIKIFYVPFLLIFSLILSFTLLRTAITSQIGRILLIIITIGLIFVFGIKICWQQSGYTNYIQIKDKMKAYLLQWEELYSIQNIKFRMGENVDAIFIVFPSEMPDSSFVSSKLTEIQQVDENYTQNVTQSKGNKDQNHKMQVQDVSSRGTRKASTSRFDENGNLIKKVRFSKFANMNYGNQRKAQKIQRNQQFKSNKSSQKSIQEDCNQNKNQVLQYLQFKLQKGGVKIGQNNVSKNAQMFKIAKTNQATNTQLIVRTLKKISQYNQGQATIQENKQQYLNQQVYNIESKIQDVECFIGQNSEKLT